MNTSQKCAGCKLPLPKKEYLQCVSCKAKYDIECVNISSKTFNSLERKDLWKCPECVSKKPKKGNINTPVRNTMTTMEDETINDSQNVTLRAKILRPPSNSEQNSPIENREYSLEDPRSPHIDMLKELKRFMSELIEGQMASIKEAIDGLAHSIKAQNSRLEQLENRVSKLESKSNESQNIGTKPLESVIAQLQTDIAERDQALLSNDLEIAGCTESPNENCVHLTLTIAKKMGVDLDIRDVVSAERVGPTKTAADTSAPSARPLVVRLARRAPRDTLLQAARTRRDLNTEGLKLPGTIRPLYINERLTKNNRLIFHKARALARDMEFKYVWTREGRIFARRDHGTQRYRLRNEADLSRVFRKSDV